MTETKKTLSPGAKWRIVYVVYAVLCVLGSYGVLEAYSALRHRMNVTFQIVPYVFICFGLFAALGVLWAGERLLSVRAGKIMALAVRLLLTVLLTIMSMGWAVLTAIGAGNAVTDGLYAVYSAGMMPLFGLLAGYLVVDTVALMFKGAR